MTTLISLMRLRNCESSGILPFGSLNAPGTDGGPIEPLEGEIVTVGLGHARRADQHEERQGAAVAARSHLPSARLPLAFLGCQETCALC